MDKHDAQALELSQAAGFLDMTPEQFLEGVGLQKAHNTDKGLRTPGVSTPHILRGFVEPLDNWSARGVRENYAPLSFQVLREIERKNPVVSAIVNTRCRQMRPFGRYTQEIDEPGYHIVLRDARRKPTQHEQSEMHELSKWLWNTGSNNFDGWEEREDNLLDVMVKMTRDYLVIDQVALELRRDRKGRIVDFWVLDGATIRRVLSTGYRGTKSDFDPRLYVPSEDAAKIAAEKLSLVPDDMSKIAFVQTINGRFTAAYTRKDLIVDSMQKRTDIRYYGYGYSPLEQAMSAIVAFLWSMAYNAEAFNSGTLPKIALAFKDGNFSEAQLIALQDQFLANFRGVYGAWRIPMLNADVQAIDLLKSPRDMEYMKYLEFMGSLICAVMGIDPMEIGMRWQFAQQVLSENPGGRLKFSKDRGLNDLLGAVENVFDKLLMHLGVSDKYKFEFTGVDPENAEKKSKLRSEAVKRDRTVNELRAEDDLPPIEGGDILLDPTYLQFRMMQSSGGGEEGGAESGGGASEGAEGDAEFDWDKLLSGTIDDALDEAVDDVSIDMSKARLLRRNVRTLLL